MHRFISFDRCAITLYQPETDTFRFLAVEGDLRSDYFRAGLEANRNETCLDWVFEHQRPILRCDLKKEQKYANERRLAAEGIQSMCALPLVFQGKCIGALSLVSRELDRYSDEDALFLQEVANQIALAILNMKSYQEIDSLKARLEKENVYLREELHTEHNFEEIVGNSPALLRALHAVEQVASTDATVLIYGETGTGKELVARAIHSRSARSGCVLVNVNCSAISAGLVESELFGHMKGAFTGALERRIGRFELAHGGTIFLDEIGELSVETQVKLLRVLQRTRVSAGREQPPFACGRARDCRHESQPPRSCRGRPLPLRPFLPPQRISYRASRVARTPLRCSQASGLLHISFLKAVPEEDRRHFTRIDGELVELSMARKHS